MAPSLGEQIKFTRTIGWFSGWSIVLCPRCKGPLQKWPDGRAFPWTRWAYPTAGCDRYAERGATIQHARPGLELGDLMVGVLPVRCAMSSETDQSWADSVSWLSTNPLVWRSGRPNRTSIDSQSWMRRREQFRMAKLAARHREPRHLRIQPDHQRAATLQDGSGARPTHGRQQRDGLVHAPT